MDDDRASNEVNADLHFGDPKVVARAGSNITLACPGEPAPAPAAY